eukprot:403649-Amphidinium_carterae.1
MDRDEDEDRQGSVFFITLREFPEMDGKYCPFGVLTAGHRLLDRIEEDYEDLPQEVTIEELGGQKIRNIEHMPACISHKYMRKGVFR